MRVYKAQVVQATIETDPTQFRAEIMDSHEVVIVNYTTPYNSMVHGEGGFTAYPREGDVILIVAAENDPVGIYYYMSTVVGRSLLPESGMANYPKGSGKFMTGNSFKDTVAISDHYGAGLEFVAESSDSDSLVSRRSYTRLYSGNNQITMDKSPEVEGILIRTKNDAVSVKMTGPKNYKAMYGPNSLYAYARGNVGVQSHAGDIKIFTHSEGGMMSLFNMSRPDLPTGTLRDRIKGDLYLESLHNSVNIKAHAYLNLINPTAPAPKVFIEASKINPDSLVQVTSGGDLKLFSGQANPTAKTTIVAAGDIDIVSGGAIRMFGAGGIDLQSVELAGSITDLVPEPDNKTLPTG